MKIKSLYSLCYTLLLVLSVLCQAQEARAEASASVDASIRIIPEDLRPFPLPEVGFQRWVVRVPKVDDPEQRQVELMIGKVMSVDCNRHFFSGQLRSKIAQGWGYSYYVLEKVGPATSTLMACLNTSKHDAFVRVNTNREGVSLHRYNYRLPLVVYLPQGFELRYRIWQTTDEMSAAKTE